MQNCRIKESWHFAEYSANEASFEEFLHILTKKHLFFPCRILQIALPLHNALLDIKIGIHIYQKQCRKNLKRVKLTKTFVKCISRGTTSSLTHCPLNLVRLTPWTICRGVVVQPPCDNYCSVYPR